MGEPTTPGGAGTPSAASSVGVTSVVCTSPVCRVDELRRYPAYVSPVGAGPRTARSCRRARPPASASEATTTVAVEGRLPSTAPSRRSTADTWAAVPPGRSRTAPRSTASSAGRPASALFTWSASDGAAASGGVVSTPPSAAVATPGQAWVTVPPAPARAMPAPGPTAAASSPARERASPSRPGCALPGASAARRVYVAQRSTSAGEPSTGVDAQAGERQAPGSSAARAPAETASQPSTGQVLGRTLRADATAIAPSEPRAVSAGVPTPVSDQRTPP